MLARRRTPTFAHINNQRIAFLTSKIALDGSFHE
jgi:hypothetical protein